MKLHLDIKLQERSKEGGRALKRADLGDSSRSFLTKALSTRRGL